MVTLVLIAVLAALVADGEASSNEEPVRTAFYQGIPIDINLRLNEESRIHVDESIEIGLPPVLTSKLDIASVHGIVYLTALQSFTRQRLVLKGVQTGRFVLLDVSASNDALRIEDLYVRAGNPASALAALPSISPAELLRFVAHKTLSPRVLKSKSPQVKRTAITLSPNAVYLGFGIDSSLLSAWRTEKWLALAIELRNESEDSVRVDPHHVGGTWNSAAFTHTRLLPRGKRGSQTVMFLVGAHDAIAELRQ